MVGGREAEPPLTQQLFTQDWAIYRKMVDNDYLFHRGAYGCLKEVLTKDVDRPFLFLDIACGDAGTVTEALTGTKIAGYYGIDVSKQALDIAERNLVSLGCPIRFEQRNFVDALDAWTERLDIVWIGLSLHHLRAPEKLQVMKRIRGLIGEDGWLLIYENASPDGESRETWLERWDAQKSAWTAYTPAEWAYVTAHVHASDFPETETGWRNLGAEAGFNSIAAMYVCPSNLFRLYSFRP
jgi:ubiquinone/menaquinone biosynthesis C-methylase UbiE